MKNSVRLLAVLLAGVCMCSTGGAAGLTGTLKKIKETGAIALGYRETSMPFSYLDGEGRVVGYSHDIMLRVVEAIRRELALPGLDINLIAITSQNRIPLMLNQTIDLECGSTTNNTERQRQVAFSNTLFVTGTRLLARRDAGIRDFADLAGRSVVTDADTTSERLLRKLNDEQKLHMNIVITVDHGIEPLAVLQAGQAEAYMMDDALLHAVRSKAWRPQEWVVTGTPQSYEAYGCMMRKGDTAFKSVVDQAIATIMTSGEAETIYRKWFMSPIPPNGINLDFPLSADMQKLYKNPNDKAFD